MPRTRRLLAPLALTLAVLAPVAPAQAGVQAAQSPKTALKKALTREMGHAAAASGAYVADADTGTGLFGWKSGSRRILASNTKMFTAGATLALRQPGGVFQTQVLGVGAIDPLGTWRGNLYLRGAGDPAFGSDSYNGPRYGGGGSLDTLAQALYDNGLRYVEGGVVGDESLFDSLRGTAYSGFGGSGDIGGPLTALAYNHGRTGAGRFQTKPPVYAAGRLADALRRLGVEVEDPARAGQTPDSAVELANVGSLPMARLTQITGVRSENWFAEMLVKGLSGVGTTAGGTAEVRDYAGRLGVNVSVVDGSGLSRSNQASPRQVVRFLLAERGRSEFEAFRSSLATAGVSGTLATRMRSGAARGNCRAKTGTLRDVSALSGYCTTVNGRTLVFSILMNSTSIRPAQRIQDRIAQAVAGYRG
jgi:D-alanyl-D-alanine carboxypeptidase/D-alanyl-D-alanine-endopeptidase (penicillin-binding protein 4)